MRFRRNRRISHKRASGKKGDWIILANDLCRTNVPIESCEDPTAAAAALGSVELVSSADIGSKQDTLTIVRCVGEIQTMLNVRVTALATAKSVLTYMFCEGIYKSAVDDAGIATILDPRVSLDMESDHWLWRRTTLFHFLAENNGASTVSQQFDRDAVLPFGAHIDIRVKRKLVAGDNLLYTGVFAKEAVLGGTVTNVEDVGSSFFSLRGYVLF